MKKGEFLAVFQILILFLAIVSFCESVSGDTGAEFSNPETLDPTAGASSGWFESLEKSTVVTPTKVTPPVDTTDTSAAKSGGILSMFTKTPTSAIGGIAQGAAWGGIVMGE